MNTKIGDIILVRVTLGQELKERCLKEFVEYKNNCQVSDSFSQDIADILGSKVEKEQNFITLLQTILHTLRLIAAIKIL